MTRTCLSGNLDHLPPDTESPGAHDSCSTGLPWPSQRADWACAAGIVGLIFYSLMSGVPIIMIAWLGCAVQKRIPGVVSLSDYALRVRQPQSPCHLTLILPCTICSYCQRGHGCMEIKT